MVLLRPESDIKGQGGRAPVKRRAFTPLGSSPSFTAPPSAPPSAPPPAVGTSAQPISHRGVLSRLSPSAARTLALTVLCTALVVAETLALLSTGGGAPLAMAPQVAAPAPWGIFHDERWLLVHAGSWPAVIAGAIAIIGVRGALTAVMVKLAWPDSAPDSAEPPSWRVALVRGWTSTLVAALLMSLCASLLVAFAMAPISDLWLAAVPTALGVALFVHHGPVDSWWLRHPRLRSMGWVLTSFVALTLGGAAMVTAPQGWAPAIAAGVGVVDAWMWRGMVRSLARPSRLRWAMVSPIGLVGVVAITVVSVTAAATPSGNAASHPPRPAGTSASGAAAHQPATHAGPKKPVLLVSGYGVRWSGHPVSLGPGFKVREFSYRGTTKHGKPLPYDSAATEAPLPDLLREFRAQVNSFVQKTGKHISIVGESEGSLLATIYLLTTPSPPVDEVVLLSPLVRPGRAGYPGPDGDGPGIAAGWALRGIANATNALTPLHVSPDSPFIRSLGSHADALRYAFGCPAPGVRQFAIIPLVDAVGVPPGALSSIAHETVTALHGTLLVDPTVRYDVAQDLKGVTTHHTDGNGGERVVAALSSAWQAPPRRLGADPPTTLGCAHARDALRAWLD